MRSSMRRMEKSQSHLQEGSGNACLKASADWRNKNAS